VEKNQEEQYSTDLKKVRFLKNRAFIVFLGFVPWTIATNWIAGELGLKSKNSFFFVSIPYGLFYLYCFIGMIEAICPRCKKKIFHKPSGFMSYGKCWNCGLKI
jgi:hypothetical protein